MPILDHLNGRPEDDRPKRKDPEFVARSTGGRHFTLEALREQVEAQFEQETAGRFDILQEADTPDARRELLLESVNYVLAVESVHITREEKNHLLEATYANLFGFGPLESYLGDETLTEITINGPHDLHARYGFGKLARLPVYFDDAAHLRRTVDRQLMMHGAQLVEWNFFLEAGVALHGRPARLSLITPPVTPQLQVEVRLHPRAPLTLEDLIASGVLSEATARVITDHLVEEGGLLIVGDAGTGKTTLLGALLHALPGQVTLVQRAAELRPPEGVTERNAFPPTDDDPGWSLNERVEAILSEAPPDWLVLDEVRDDAAQAAWDAINAREVGCVWAFRGDPDPGRVRSALSMMIRRALPAADQPEAELNRLFVERLPLVALLAVHDEAPRVVGLSELVLTDEGALELRSRAD